MKTAEEIVRALAEHGPPTDQDGFLCGFDECSATLGEEQHADECPYRMAVEWVAAREGEKPTACTRCESSGTVAASRAAKWNCQAEGCGGQMVIGRRTNHAQDRDTTQSRRTREQLQLRHEHGAAD